MKPIIKPSAWEQFKEALSMTIAFLILVVLAGIAWYEQKREGR